jgi:hypothetical protein
MTTAAAALGNRGGSGGNHFVRGAFGHPFHHRLRFRKTLIIPYSYYDYDYAADPLGDVAVYPLPTVSSAPPASSATACHRNVEMFTVPSEDGGTRQITIINCP